MEIRYWSKRIEDDSSYGVNELFCPDCGFNNGNPLRSLAEGDGERICTRCVKCEVLFEYSFKIKMDD